MVQMTEIYLVQACRAMSNDEAGDQDRGCHHGIAKHAAPFADRAIGGDQDRSPLITPRHQLEEQMRGIGFEREIAELGRDRVVSCFSSEPSLWALASIATSVAAVKNWTL